MRARRLIPGGRAGRHSPFPRRLFRIPLPAERPVADALFGRGWTPGRNRSAWLDIRLSEVVADKEQRFIHRFGEGVDRTVAHIELRRMPLTFAIALECIGGQARLVSSNGVTRTSISSRKRSSFSSNAGCSRPRTTI